MVACHKRFLERVSGGRRITTKVPTESYTMRHNARYFWKERYCLEDERRDLPHRVVGFREIDIIVRIRLASSTSNASKEGFTVGLSATKRYKKRYKELI